jgi:dTDP-4-dehydrorhamnose reductase
MKALVIGASGLVGEALTRTYPFQEVCIGTSNRQQLAGSISLNIEAPQQVTETLQDFQPEVVILCAANPNVDYCEREPEKTRATNVNGVESVAEACANLNAKLIFFSSDYVFDGTSGPYAESDSPNPICVYGKQKLEAEQIVTEMNPDINLILRITGVFGQERQGKNFVYRALDALRNHKLLKVPNDQYGNPTLSDDLANAVWKLAHLGTNGILHLAGETYLNRLEFTQLIAQTFSLSTDHIQGVTTHELAQDAPRPLRAGLLSHKAVKLLEHPLLDTRTGLEKLLNIGIL